MTVILFQIFYCVVMLVLIAGVISMELASRKASVSPAPSLPWMRKAVIQEMLRLIEEKGIESPLIYEPGSGWGALAIAAAKAYPDAQVVGYEISAVPRLISKFRAWIGGHKNLSFESQSFFDADFAKVDFVLTYLTINLLDQLAEKKAVNMKQGSHIICNTFPITGWAPIAEIPVKKMIYDFKVYVYEIGKHRE